MRAPLILACSAALSTALFTACESRRPRVKAAKRQDLREYKRTHYAALPQSAGPARSWNDFDALVGASSLVLAGDLHDDTRLHARFERLVDRCLDAAMRSGRRLRLWVEFLGTLDEANAASFARREIGLGELRARLARRGVSWLDERGLDAAFYRRLLVRARDTAVEVRALETIPRPPLQHRDSAMAARLRTAQREDVLDLVLVGHAHLLGAGHLVDALAARARDAVVVLPNVGLEGARDHPFVELAPRMLSWRR